MRITGGEYKNRSYSCCYDPNGNADRAENGLFGILGVQYWYDNAGCFSKRPAMLWFRKNETRGLDFVSAERYFEELDMTYSDLLKDLEYDLNVFEPVDNEGTTMEGPAYYRGEKYPARCSTTTGTATWEEDVVLSVAEALIRERRKAAARQR